MVQVVRQTWQERFDMYMKHTKKELASMLAESAKYTSPDSCVECASKETEYGESTSASTETCDDWTYEYEGEKYEI